MRESTITDGIRIVDLGLFVEQPKCLSIADLQLGHEETMSKQGVFVPRFNFEEIKKRLEKKILPKIKADKIVVNGDLKHGFGRASEQEWEEVTDMLQLLKKHCRQIVFVKGNHDVYLGPIAKWESIGIESEFFLEKEKVFFTHGHRINKTKEFRKAETIVIGHEHPAISIREGAKTERFKCFLKGKFGKKTIIVQPSMSAIAIGTDIMQGSFLSPFLKKGLDGFEVWAVEDKPYYFGRIGETMQQI